MKDHTLEYKVRQDAARVKRDINALVDDSVARFNRLSGDVSHATGKATAGITNWMEEGATQVSDGFEKLAEDAKEIIGETATTVRKDVGHGLSEYNSRAQDLADKVPGGIGKKAAKYPWVAISIALLAGFAMSSLIRPRH